MCIRDSPYTVHPDSEVAKAHPDWLLGSPWGGTDWRGAEWGATLDLSQRQVSDYLKQQLDSFVTRWGDFEWRNDSFMVYPRGGDDTVLLAQDQGMRDVIE